MIRRRLVASIVALVAVVIVLTGFLVIDRFERRLVDAVDERLPARAAALRGGLAGRFPGPPGRVTVRPDLTGPDLTGPDDYGPSAGLDARSVAIVWLDPSGTTVAALPAGPADDPEPLPDVSGLVGDGVDPPAGTVTLHGVDGAGPRYRAEVDPTSDGGAVVVAASLAGVDAAVAQARWILLVAGSVAAGVVAIVVWVIVRRGLAPIDDVVATAERIAAGEVAERAPVPQPDSEVGHLALALNTMLDRLQDAADARTASEQRTRRFAADASHELRTPLTSIRGYAELYRRGARDPDAVSLAMDRIEHEATRMGVLVDDLLLLARLDQRRPTVETDVDLGEIARVAVEDARATRPGAAMSFQRSTGDRAGEHALRVRGDPHQLRRVVDNLLANARDHTDPDTAVRVTVEEVEGEVGAEVRLAVSDDGPGMTAEAAARAFDRFWQDEPTTEHPRPGTGLGLSIVAELVKGHGGHIDLRTAPGEGTTFTIVLPLAAPPSDPTPMLGPDPIGPAPAATSRPS